MRFVARPLILAMVVISLVTTVVLVSRMAAQQRTPIVIDIYTGPDGETHDKKIDVKFSPWVGLSTAERSEALKAANLQFRRFPPGWVNDWHPAPVRQYVITLSGRGEIEMAGGRKITLKPGSIFLAEDLTGKGHISRTIGKEDWINVAVNQASQ
jgi:hypothetical protein